MSIKRMMLGLALVLTVVAGFAIMAQPSTAARGDARAPLTLGMQPGDIDHAFQAYEPFRNRLDGAPRIDRVADCARLSFPYVSDACRARPGSQPSIRVITIDSRTASR